MTTEALKVYLAGSSDPRERERILECKAMLEGLGFNVTSTWRADIDGRNRGVANPVDATVEQQLEWSDICLTQISEADIFVLIFPNEAPSFGIIGEMIHANWCDVYTVVCGRRMWRSIFTAQADARIYVDGELVGWMQDWAQCEIMQRVIDGNLVKAKLDNLDGMSVSLHTSDDGVSGD